MYRGGSELAYSIFSAILWTRKCRLWVTAFVLIYNCSDSRIKIAERRQICNIDGVVDLGSHRLGALLRGLMAPDLLTDLEI